MRILELEWNAIPSQPPCFVSPSTPPENNGALRLACLLEASSMLSFYFVQDGKRKKEVLRQPGKAKQKDTCKICQQETLSCKCVFKLGTSNKHEKVSSKFMCGSFSRPSYTTWQWRHPSNPKRTSYSSSFIANACFCVLKNIKIRFVIFVFDTIWRR